MHTKKILILSTIFTLASIFLLSPSTSATSGALKKASIKKCPNGLTYGYHGKNNHWHQAEASNTSSGWSAVGSELSGDPCPSGGSSNINSTPKKTTTQTNNSSSKSSTPSSSSTPKSSSASTNSSSSTKAQSSSSSSSSSTNNTQTTTQTSEKEVAKPEEPGDDAKTTSEVEDAKDTSAEATGANDTEKSSSNAYSRTSYSATSTPKSSSRSSVFTTIGGLAAVSGIGYGIYRKVRK
ncbi:hypothetical protein IJJ46_02230 [Candidatus Saccharibacteria bacterium]|nr:hypothetical protein [Candidatus Saccharibacteria bacterium]